MPGIPVNTTVLNEMTRQFNHELTAAQGYLAMALWCDDQNLKGFSAFFYKQADEERLHARKFMDFLLDRGVLPELQIIAAPASKFESLLALAQKAQLMEQINTTGINQVYEAALAAKDYPTQTFLQWFINEQVEEEAWADEMVERVQRATCCGGLMDLDRHIERYLFGEKS